MRPVGVVLGHPGIDHRLRLAERGEGVAGQTLPTQRAVETLDLPRGGGRADLARSDKRHPRSHTELVGLTWHNPNSLVLVEGPEIAIQPVGIRWLPSDVAQVKRQGGDA